MQTTKVKLKEEAEILYRQIYDLELQIKNLTEINKDLRTRIILLKRQISVNVGKSTTK